MMKSRKQNSAQPAHNGHHRAKSTRNAASVNKPSSSNGSTQHISTPAPQPQPTPQPTTGMSPALRYMQNLKVLRRQDPSIVSIIDQFSHVCIYHYDGAKWEKKGFEGSFFLFERRAYPPYGFFILNRMGMDDYIQYIYPEDDLDIQNAFLLYRSFPEFSANRLARSRSLPPYTEELPLEIYTNTHTSAPEPDDPLTNWKLLVTASGSDKGRSETIGLWMHETGGRDVKEIMKGLHSYIKACVRYPDELRNTPGHSEQGTGTSPHQAGIQTQPHPQPNGAGSAELDKLFSKLTPSVAAAPTLLPPKPTTPDGKITLEAIFASASTNAPVSLPTLPSTSTPGLAPSSTSSNSSANRGIALLNSIFASATPPVSANNEISSQAQVSAASLTPNSKPLSAAMNKIHSPKPAVAGLPQILTQDVISQLMGLPSPLTSPSDIQSPLQEASTGTSVSTTDATESRRVLKPPANNLMGTEGKSSVNGHVLGDVTPRASVVKPAPTQGSRTGTPKAHRTLVPFHEESSLWPYPRAPLDDRDSSAELDNEDTSNGDLVELDFADTQALSDINTFSRVQKQTLAKTQKKGPKQVQKGANGEKEGNDAKNESTPVLDRATGVQTNNETCEGDKKRRRNKRSARKERERAEKEEIEKGWDVPKPVTVSSPVHAPNASQPTLNGHHASAAQENPTSSSHAGATKIDINNLLVAAAQTSPVKSTLVAAGADIHTRLAPSPPLERDAFVNEVLTLFNTDKPFVDQLYNTYLKRAGAQQ